VRSTRSLNRVHCGCAYLTDPHIQGKSCNYTRISHELQFLVLRYTRSVPTSARVVQEVRSRTHFFLEKFDQNDVKITGNKRVHMSTICSGLSKSIFRGSAEEVHQVHHQATSLTGVATDLCSGMGDLFVRWDKCLNKYGDYVAKKLMYARFFQCTLTLF
jgi:hypothetical protein